MSPAIVLGLLTLATTTADEGEAPSFDPGPAVGSRLPALNLPDQTGRARTFDDLRGEEGLLLLVYRSADW
jgi:hypothetical protein